MTSKSRAPLLEVDRVGLRLGYAPAYVRQLIHRGQLRAVRIGTRWRFREEDIEAFIEARLTPPVRRQTDARSLQAASR